MNFLTIKLLFDKKNDFCENSVNYTFCIQTRSTLSYITIQILV